MTVWMCRVNGDAPTEHDTEEAAMTRADELARENKVAVVWPVEVTE